MTRDDIAGQIGEAAIERKECLDKASCYEARLKNALYGIQALLAEDSNPLHEDNQRILTHATDPRADAKGYIAAIKRADELAEFLRRHNAL